MTSSLKFKHFVPALVWLLLILILSGYPGKQLPKIPIWQIDKFAHTIMYGVLSVCLCLPFIKQFHEKKRHVIIGVKIVFFGICYGGIMEILQTHIFINRSGNWYDFLSNSLGAILGVLIFYVLIKILPINRWFKIS